MKNLSRAKLKMEYRFSSLPGWHLGRAYSALEKAEDLARRGYTSRAKSFAGGVIALLANHQEAKPIIEAIQDWIDNLEKE